MDIEDPIQQLLKNTGWSCDDLLEKLQKYKCQKGSNGEETVKPIDKDSADPKECNNSTSETNNIPKVQNLEPKEEKEKIPEVHNEKTDIDTSNCHIVNEEFSDTDEEESEVNATHSNIINEIIDEISTGETEGSRDKNDNLDYHTETDRDDEATEVTEVRVIQVNTDDEDDDLFTDEGCQIIQNSDEILNSNKFEYLETHPRNISSVKNQSLINESNCKETKVDEEESVAGYQITNKNQPLIDAKVGNKDNEVDCKEHDKSVATIDENIDSTCSKTKLLTEEKRDLHIKTSSGNNVETAKKELSSKNLSLENISGSQMNLSKTCEEAKLMTDRTNPLHSDDERIIKNCNEHTGEKSISENLNDIQNHFKTQLNYMNTHKETKSAPKQRIDNPDLGLEANNNSHIEKESTPENLRDLQSNSKSKLNCLSVHEKAKLITESNSSCLDIERNDETHDVEEQTRSKNLEDIRNNLKLQLNSLRTRKKGQFLQDLRNNVPNVADYNKKMVNNCDKDKSSIENVDKSHKTENKELENKVPSSKNDNSEDDYLDDKLYTQTNEFGLVILNVQGGIDLDEFENLSSEDNLNENSSNTNASVLEASTDFNDSSHLYHSNVETDEQEIEQGNGVFDEIRKIIRKQKVNTLKKNKKSLAILASKIDKPETNIDNFGIFSGSSELEAADGKTNDYRKSRVNTDTSTENSSSSFTAEDTNQTVDKNSPFVSNTLDEFLTGDSKLNISYNVPKCGAEEGLSESYHDDSPLLLKKVVKVNKEQSPKPKKLKIIKAKTLAQKRKMLEKQRLQQLKNSKVALESNRETIKSESTEITEEKNYSFVMLDDKKIWVKSVTPTSCIAKINTKKATAESELGKQKKINQRQRKLSLLMDLGKKLKKEIKYRPGPMCKKADLQISGQDNWETEMKSLPKILLEVIPKIGKPIPPNIISRLPQYDGKLTENQIEFALSVLKMKTDVEQKIFQFPLSYSKNQEKIFVRKQKIPPVKYATTKKHDEEKSVDSVVSDIINDLITYVEIKEMAPSLIKEEEGMRDSVADDKFAKMPMIADNVSSIFKKPQKKKSRIELELSRLSCKVVNVEVEENLTREICDKPFCQLGCVCNSLKCDRILTYHCGKVQCMLDCTCPKERALVYDKVTLPAGTDILSNDAVSRIEDEAKKDLAKVEREFTQTVIHTSDKTIVVGLGGRNKSKRTTKVPKKYSDYVDSFEGVKEGEKEKDIDKNDFLRKCVVNLDNLNLSDVIPFCLTHDLYDCHCKGRSLYTSDQSLSSESIVIEDDEEFITKRQTYNPIKYKNKLKHAKQFVGEHDYNTKRGSQIIPANEHENSRSEVASGDMIEKKQTASFKKYNKTKSAELESAQRLEEIHNEDIQEEFIDNKQSEYLKKYSHVKTPQLKPVVAKGKKQTANPKKSVKNKCAQLKPVHEDTDADNRVEVQENIENEMSTFKTPSKNKISQLKKTKNLKKSHSELDSINSSPEPISSSGRPVRTIKRVKLREDFSYLYQFPEDCARVRGMSNHVLKTYKDINKNKRNVQKNDFINNISEADLLKSRINYNLDTRQMLEVDLLKKQLIDESNRQKKAVSLLVNDNSKHKRKQTLEVRNDDNSTKISFNQAIQRRKKPAFVTQKNAIIEAVFDGEIIIDSRNMELLEKMGPRTVLDGYARLLPWKVLTESYRNGTIKIWSMLDAPSRLLINKSDKLPPKNYINITQVKPITEVILWILRNKLPSTYHEDHVSFILKQTKDHYEICGLCTKNFSEDESTKEAPDKSCSESESVAEQAEDGLTFPHKDLNGISQLLYIEKDKFKLQELIEESLAAMGETSVSKNRLYMWAALPEIFRVGKWRIIFLNSDFTYLYFTKLKYSIKYTDLVNMGNRAKAGNCTVMLRNPLIRQAYSHESFGIYFDSHYQDRIFIGPYSKEFNGDDIETLRYINKSLVCNESFHKMIGKTDYKCGHWLIERPYGGQPERQPEQTIDLTHDSHQITNKRKSDSDVGECAKRPRIEELKRRGRMVIIHNREQIRVIDAAPRKPEDFNRYIITNIPHFGYLGAYKHSNSNEIDVSWPFENKLLRFPSVNSAIDFLQERFSSLLQPIPENFKINVIVMTQIDLENSQPVDAQILSGHFICGEFGYYNVKNISDELCISIVGMKREELLRIFAKRAQAFVRKKIEELADILNIEKSEVGRYDIVNILDMAQREIDALKEIEKFNSAKKRKLVQEKQDRAVKLFDIIKELPERQQASENLTFMKIIGKAPTRQLKNKTEPIVIPDSDEEEDVSNSSKGSTSYEEPQQITERTNFGLNSTGLKSILLHTAETDKVRSQDGSIFSIVYNKTIPTKMTETASIFPPRTNVKLKSVLKPLPTTASSTIISRVTPSTSVSTTNSIENNACQTLSNSKCIKPQYLTGVKIIKTNSGKFVLVSDKNEAKPFKMPEAIKGTKIIIKNSKILSVKKMDADDDCEQDISASDSISGKINVTSPTNENTIVNRNILEATSPSKDTATHPCLENETVEKTVSESSEILNESANLVQEINTAVSDEALSACSDKESGDNDSDTEVGNKNG